MNITIKSEVMDNEELYSISFSNDTVIITNYNIDALNKLATLHYSDKDNADVKAEFKRMLNEYVTFTLTTARYKNKAKTMKKFDRSLIDSFANNFDLYPHFIKHYKTIGKSKPSSFMYMLVHHRFIDFLKANKSNYQQQKSNWKQFVDNNGEYISERKASSIEATFSDSDISLDTLLDQGIEVGVDNTSFKAEVERNALFDYYKMMIEFLKISDLDEKTKEEYLFILDNRENPTMLRDYLNTSYKGVRMKQVKAYKFISNHIGTFEDFLERHVM